MPRIHLRWTRDGHRFEAIEPGPDLVERHADILRDWYNAHDNASMMDGSGAMTREDVLEFWASMRERGARGFLGFCDGELIGDGDVRGVRDGAAEFAVMIGGAAHKGRGLGRTLSLLIHVFAFRELGLARIYVPPRKDNERVHALNRFLGYVRDESEAAQTYADGPESETYSLDRATFAALHADAYREVEARAEGGR